MGEPDGGDRRPACRPVHDPVGGLTLAGTVGGTETCVADAEWNREVCLGGGALAGCAARGRGVGGGLERRRRVRFDEESETETGTGGRRGHGGRGRPVGAPMDIVDLYLALRTLRGSG